MQELVSVIITTCNGDNRLCRAIRSVISQTYDNIEIIVVDDNGEATEGQIKTEKLLREFIASNTISYIKHDVNRNGAVARNTGFKQSRGKYIAFLDDDDYYMPTRIEKMVSAMSSSDVSAVYSDVFFFYNNRIESEMKAKRSGFTAEELMIYGSLLGTGSNIFVKRESYEKLGGFDETFNRYQDLEFMIRVLEKGNIVGVGEPLVVKDISDLRFFPQYSKMLNTQQHFISKFLNEINHLSSKNRRTFYFYRRKELLLSAYFSKNKKNIEEAQKLLISDVGSLSLKEKASIAIRRIYMLYIYSQFGFVRKFVHFSKRKRFAIKADSDTKAAVNEALRIASY